MLGRLQMSTKEALTAYDSFASEIFSKRRKSLVEKYKAKALEETVKRLVRDQAKGFSMRDRRPAEAKGHAFVCTMPEKRHKEVVRLRTYDVKGDKYPNCLIVEAARATTAATTYFRPMAIRDEEGNQEMFVDAALGTNNPISVLWDEASDLYGKKRKLGCVVSLGTGSRDVEMVSNGDRLVEKMKFLISAAKLTKELGTDSEKDHLRWQAKFEEFEHTYFRLNVDGGAQGIELSEWEKIEELKRRTREYLQAPNVKEMVDDLAEVLLDSRDSGLTLAHGGKYNEYPSSSLCTSSSPPTGLICPSSLWTIVPYPPGKMFVLEGLPGSKMIHSVAALLGIALNRKQKVDLARKPLYQQSQEPFAGANRAISSRAGPQF